MRMAGGGEGCCYFHPKEIVVGVCPLCLHERLLTLLPSSSSKQSHKHSHSHSHSTSKSIINLFSFPSLLLRHSTSTFHHHQDSFMSMKIEDNGSGSWEKKKVKEEDEESKSKRVVGHVKSRGSVRWRKRIGQMLQLMRWKKRSNVCPVGSKVEGVKLTKKKHKQGWIKY